MSNSAMARKLVHVVVTVYITSAIVYSSYTLLMIAALKIMGFVTHVSATAGTRGGEKSRNLKQALIPPVLPEETLYWPATPMDEYASNAVAMRESLFLSKAFSQSMQPCKIIPFYYKGSATFENDDITLTTVVTFNRFKVFGELAKRYRGTMTVAFGDFLVE